MGCFSKKIVFLEGLCGVESANYGPSEILCIADSSTSPDIVASSMIAQSEHSQDVLSICITKDRKLINKIRRSIKDQLKDLPRKQDSKKKFE